MRRWYFRTIRTYVAAIINFFKDLEIQTTDSAGNVVSVNVPIAYISKEKSQMFQDVSDFQHLTGNTNVLPRGVVSLISMQRDDTRQTNRNIKTNRIRKDSVIEYTYNSVSYSFIFNVKLYCRGMNEASMLVEEIAPKFNPNCSIDVYDTDNLDTPTRLPIRLIDLAIEEFDPLSETSSNIFTVDCTCQLEGQLYAPIQMTSPVNNFGINLYKNDSFVAGFDSNTGWFEEKINDIIIKGFDKKSLQRGVNTLELVYRTTADDDVSFKWSVEQGDAIIRKTDRNKIEVTVDGKFVDITCVVSSGILKRTITRTFVIDD